MTTAKRFVPLALLCFAFALTSCVIVAPKSKRQRSSRRCHPSQYWDGYRCVHKGKARGHKKHKHRGKGKGHKKHKHDHRDY